MEDKELIQKIQSLKQIKPNQDWANWLKANILQTKPSVLITSEVKQSDNKPKVRLAVFSFLAKYQKAVIPSLLAFFFICSFAFAQTSLPGSVLYSVKTLTQNAKIYLAPDNIKPLVRLEIARARIEDLSKVQNHKKEISAVIQNVQKDLEILPEEIKKINKKETALNVSREIQKKSEDLKTISERISLEAKDKEKLNETMENTQSQVLAFIVETTEEINQCPSYLQKELEDLGRYFSNDQNQSLSSQWTIEDITKCKNLLLEANNAFKAGDCLTALEKIESVNQILKIHSLD